MAITVSYTSNVFTPGTDTTQSTQVLRGKLVFSGSYPGTPGDTLNFTTHAVGVANPLVSNQRPIGVSFWEEPVSGTAVAGVSGLMSYRNISAKPTAANGVVTIVTGASISGTTVTAGTELGSGAYSATITGAVILFEAIFVLGR